MTSNTTKKNRKRIGASLNGVGNHVLGTCVDCGEPSRLRDEYIVRGEVWAEAGMHGWEAGYLHRSCLELRLGRKLTEDELLVTVASETRDAVNLHAHDDYTSSPEYLEHAADALNEGSKR